jgi:hypothetical protein
MSAKANGAETGISAIARHAAWQGDGWQARL